ncbi:hypothetical protein KXQ82_00550 [Mucilaginibacter sp. HMF5004]|uniref:hypothetical protein n=1 Tax=Mucilaginibacter rivuli TaxID=2857527 RepID=UPI001C5F1574|nr:hypothetical protein [Mucilaginibacter rivuli]MBW4888176.1 hypothetical protein [Mucilaginibacter rivuli]
MKTVTYYTQKKAIILSLSAVYLLMCIVILFVMPKSNNGWFANTNKIGYAKISNGGFKGVKNTIKRTDKVSTSTRKSLCSIHSFVFKMVYRHTLPVETTNQNRYAKVSTHPTVPVKFGCLLNCCRRI